MFVWWGGLEVLIPLLAGEKCATYFRWFSSFCSSYKMCAIFFQDWAVANDLVKRMQSHQLIGEWHKPMQLLLALPNSATSDNFSIWTFFFDDIRIGWKFFGYVKWNLNQNQDFRSFLYPQLDQLLTMTVLKTKYENTWPRKKMMPSQGNKEDRWNSGKQRYMMSR